jgi:hypothetical protein
VGKSRRSLGWNRVEGERREREGRRREEENRAECKRMTLTEVELKTSVKETE